MTATLTRRGSPNIPYVYVTDPNMMEGDSHVWLPEVKGEGDAVRVLSILHTSYEDRDIALELVPNRQGRLGKIRTVLRVGRVQAMPTLRRIVSSTPSCVTSTTGTTYQSGVTQINVAELATLTFLKYASVTLGTALQ